MTSSSSGFLIAIPLLACAMVAQAEDEPPTNCIVPVQNEKNEAERKVEVDKINVNIHPVFEPDENGNLNWIFRTVNALHIDTHPGTIKDDMLFREGDKVDVKLLDESERRLRARSYLNEVNVERVDPCAPHTDVKVDVREVWTLLPEIKYSHTGGKKSYSVGLTDANFLGFGKTVTVAHTSSLERDGNVFEYQDPNVGHTNSIFSFLYADNSDGVHKNVEYQRPFASLTTDWTAGVSYTSFAQEDTLYDIGEEVDRFGHDRDEKTIFYGRRFGFSSRETTHRWLVGYTQEEDKFYSVLDGDPPVASIFVPDDRQYKYPWVEYQYIDDKYIKVNNLEQINRVEDVNLGAELRVRLGHATSRMAKYDGAYTFEGEFTQAFSISQYQTVLTSVELDGFYRDGELFNGKTKAVASYHWQNFKRGQFFVEYTRAEGYKMQQELPLELGGDVGLRGYPIRYQAGEHLELINIEQRYFGQKEWFSLFHMGAVIFYDEGRAWGNSPIPQTERGRLRDVGVGLRLSGTRTGNRYEGGHNILHIDLAYPLDGDETLDKYQWLVTVQKRF